MPIEGKLVLVQFVQPGPFLPELLELFEFGPAFEFLQAPSIALRARLQQQLSQIRFRCQSLSTRLTDFLSLALGAFATSAQLLGR